MYAVVPAHDEAPTVGAVVRALVGSRALEGVVVIDDGSTDDTSTVATDAGARVVRLEHNVGKGEAMLTGVATLAELGDRSDRVLFVDADRLCIESLRLDRGSGAHRVASAPFGSALLRA